MQPCACSGLRSFVPRPDKIPAEHSPFPPPPDGTTSLPPKKFQGKRRSSGTPPTEGTFAGEAPRCGLPDKRYPPRTNSTARLPRTLLPHSRRFAPYIPNEHPARHAPGAPPPRPPPERRKTGQGPRDIPPLLSMYTLRKKEKRNHRNAIPTSGSRKFVHLPAPAYRVPHRASAGPGFGQPILSQRILKPRSGEPYPNLPPKHSERLSSGKNHEAPAAEHHTPRNSRRPAAPRPEQRTSYLPRQKHPVAAQRRIRIGEGERDPQNDTFPDAPTARMRPRPTSE